MAQRFFSILLMALLMFGFSIVRAESTASLEEQPFRMLNYDQFRRLNDANQMAYLEEVRNMLVELSEKGYDVTDLLLQLHNSLGSRWAFFLSMLNQPAEAADSDWCGDYNFTYDSNKGQYCVARNNALGSWFTRCGDTATSYIKSCPTKFNQVRAQAESKLESNANGSANKQMQDLNKKSEEVQKATQQYQDEKYGDQSMAKKGEDKGHWQAASAKDVDTNKDKVPKKFRCIYAGFTIYGNDCKPQEKYVDPKTNTVYTCKGPSAGEKQEMGVVAPSKPDPKKSILCNPVFFGTVPNAGAKDDKDKGTPICVAKGKNATADCLKEANKNKDASLKSAVKFAKDDKTKYDELYNTLTKMCAPQGAFTVDSGLSEASKKDLAATCEKYRDRMFDYAQEYGKSGGGQGAK